MKPLISKRPTDSTYEKRLPFSKDAELRDAYVNFFGDLRFGIILEELDWAAGMISYAHADGQERGLTIVTAACDRIDLLAPLRNDRDLLITGHVNYVGSSSMECGIRLISFDDKGGSQTMVDAYFIMVAREGFKAAKVNPLEPQTEAEIREFQEAQKRRDLRKAAARADFKLQAPTADESKLIHQLFLDMGAGKLEGVPMASTKAESTVLMHPQERNIHHKIFGGHIMRLSFELGWTVANLFCKGRPLFLNVDQFEFLKPVEIGSILSLKGQVTFTGRSSFIVAVTAEVINAKTGDRDVTNISYFTFAAVDQLRRPRKAPQVLPSNYEESLQYLDGRRRYLNGKELRAKR